MSERVPLLRQRRRRWVIAAIVLTGLIVADRSGWLLVGRGDDMTAYHGAEFRVGRVIDGDTIEIEIPDPRRRRSATQVRLLGIDCPERAGPRRATAEPFADEALMLARSLADGRRVRIALEPHRTRDAYGRLLAHVELADGTSLNEALLQAGLARADDRWPHAQLGRYAQAQRAARKDALGIWSAQ